MVTSSPLLPALHMWFPDLLHIKSLHWWTADLTRGLQITYLERYLKFIRKSPLLEWKDPMVLLRTLPSATCLESYRKAEKNDEPVCLTSFLSQKRL